MTSDEKKELKVVLTDVRRILLCIGGAFVVMFCAFAVFLLVYRHNQIQGCIRNHQNVIAPLAVFAHGAETARLTTYQETGSGADLKAYKTYKHVAFQLDHQNSLSCHKLYPLTPLGTVTPSAEAPSPGKYGLSNLYGEK